jgi:transcriptional regulator with XRE-family HTH domain
MSGSKGEERRAPELGARLRAAREFLGFSQEEVAEHMGLSRPAISNIEAGKRKVSSEELKRFAELYRRPYEYLLGETEGLAEDETTEALFRAARDLSEGDKAQVLRFAEFLRNAGPAPEPKDNEER